MSRYITQSYLIPMKKFVFAAISWLVVGLSSLCYAQREVVQLHDGWEFRQVGQEQWRAAEEPG